MRIVLDTNVVVSALLRGSIFYRLIEAASADTIELYSSPVLIAEFAEILGRAHIEKKIAEERTSAEAILTLYAQLARVVFPTDVPRVVPNDPDDVTSSLAPSRPKPTSASPAITACSPSANISASISSRALPPSPASRHARRNLRRRCA